MPILIEFRMFIKVLLVHECENLAQLFEGWAGGGHFVSIIRSCPLVRPNNVLMRSLYEDIMGRYLFWIGNS